MTFLDNNLVRLTDIAKITTGKTNSEDAVKIGAYPLFDRSQSVKRSNKHLFDCEAILVPGEGQDFIPRYYKGKFDLHQRCYAVIPHATVNAKYLYYAIYNYREHFSRVAVGSTVKSLRLASFDSFKVALPDINSQKKIADILSSLDDRITLLRETNAALEAIAQALFKSWFVDFDPVRAKAEGREPEGMPAEVADLYPSEFEDTELGEMPKGWKVGTVVEGFDLLMGQSPPGDTYNQTEDGLSFFQGRTDFGFRFPKKRMYCSAPTRLANRGDTLVSVRAPVGDVNVAIEKCCIGRGLAAVKHKSGSGPYTLYSMKGLEEAFHQFEGEGTVFGSINKVAFQNLKVISPPADVVKTFDEIASPLDAKIEANEQQLISLTDLRDTLLPRLMSGKLRIPDLEEQAA